MMEGLALIGSILVLFIIFTVVIGIISLSLAAVLDEIDKFPFFAWIITSVGFSILSYFYFASGG